MRAARRRWEERRRPGERLRRAVHSMTLYDDELCERAALKDTVRGPVKRAKTENRQPFESALELNVHDFTFRTSNRPMTHSPLLQTSPFTSQPTSMTLPTMLLPGMNPVPLPPLPILS